jgi:hypothetical protein
MKPVTVGLLTADLALVEQGLAGGESVVIEGQNQLRPGGRVEPVGKAPPKPEARPPKPEARPPKPAGAP